MDWGGGDIPALSAVNVKAGALDLSRTTHFGSEALYQRWMTQGDTARGDILITTEAPLGNVAQVPDDRKYILSQRVILLKPRPDMVDAGFLALQMRAAVFQSLLDDHRSGTTATGIRQSRLVTLPVQLPPPAEQRRIVAKLEALQARSRRAHDALDAVPPLLEKLRQSILAAAFRGDLTKDWRAKHKDVEPASELLERIRVERRRKWEEAELAKMKAKGKSPSDDKWKVKYREPEPVDATGLPELPEGWCWASVEELAHVGTGATPKRGEDRYYRGGTIAWVTSGALNDDEVTKATELVTDCAVAETNLTVYPRGTLLLAMYGEGKTRGMIAELRIEAATNQAIAAICLEGSAVATKKLVRLALVRNYAEIRSVSMGGVQPNLNLEKVRALAVPLCPSDEARILEHVVGSALEHASRLLDITRGPTASLETLNRCVLAKAFRGELVPQYPNDEPADAMLARMRAEAEDGAKEPAVLSRGKRRRVG